MIKLLVLLPIFFFILSCNEVSKGFTASSSDAYIKGESLFNAENDSAFYYFNKAAAATTDSLQLANTYSYMGIIQVSAGDYFGAQENLLISLGYLNERDLQHHNCLFSDYNELGNSSLELKNYDAAITYYDKALTFAHDTIRQIAALSHKALVYQKMRQYPQALAIYQSILQQTTTNKKRYARILSNMAKTKWLQNPAYRAAPELFTALKMKENEKDIYGLNATYAHLTDYYSTSQPDSALNFARKWYAIAQQINNADDQVEALQKLITLAPATETKANFARYQYLSDSLQTSRNNAKNQFALIRYDATKNKEENLMLQKDNAENKVRIISQRAALFATILLSVAVLLWYRKRKQEAIRKQQLKTSQKVHDVVANGLYRLMTKIEHGSVIEKEQLLDDIDILYERSRDISYEQPEDIQQEESITALLESFGNDTIRILIIGDPSKIWVMLPQNIKKELNLVLQELMTNMKKHSLANNVALKFEAHGNDLNISYTDDGWGGPATFKFGNGLKNTENRIKSIGGSISFDKTTAGLKIQLHVPIA